jgi:hypothetical protein
MMIVDARDIFETLVITVFQGTIYPEPGLIFLHAHISLLRMICDFSTYCISHPYRIYMQRHRDIMTNKNQVASEVIMTSTVYPEYIRSTCSLYVLYIHALFYVLGVCTYGV